MLTNSFFRLFISIGDQFWRSAPGYGALFLHGVSSTGLEHTLSVLSPSLGTTFTTAVAMLAATTFAPPLYPFRTPVVCYPYLQLLPQSDPHFFQLNFPPAPEMSLFSLASPPPHSLFPSVLHTVDYAVYQATNAPATAL